MTAFRLAGFMDELALACKKVNGLDRAYGYAKETVEPPAALVLWPENVTYSQSYSAGDEDEGEDQYDIPVAVIHGIGGSARSRRNETAAWISRDFKREINKYEYTGKPLVWVVSSETDAVEMGGIDYLATVFTVRVET